MLLTTKCHVKGLDENEPEKTPTGMNTKIELSDKKDWKKIGRREVIRFRSFQYLSFIVIFNPVPISVLFQFVKTQPRSGDLMFSGSLPVSNTPQHEIIS